MWDSYEAEKKGSVVGSCEYYHEHTGSIEAGNFMAA